VVYAERDGGSPTRVHVPRREVPVIVVPGLCGSRLTDPRTGELIWNPQGGPTGDSPGPFACDPARLAQISAPLVPDETHAYEYLDDYNKYKDIKHFYNVLSELYGPIALYLKDLDTDNLKKYNCKLRVYCCGYDWRQDISRGAMRLAGVVEEALRETGAKKVILVCHSMGSFVCRYYCRALGGEPKVHQLFVMGAPFMGAPEAYQQVKMGPAGVYIKDIVESVKQLQDPSTKKTTDDYEVLVDDVAWGLDNVGFVAAQAAMTTSSFGGFAGKFGMGAVGPLLLAISIGQGRFVTREEGRYLAHSLPGLFQQMPNGVFCANNKNWVFFDPMATGVRPAGFMVELPTVLEAILGSATALTDWISGDPSKPGAHARDKVQKFLEGDDGSTLTGAASRNKMTLGELIQAAVAAAEYEPLKAEALVTELLQQATRTFCDCRDYKSLYNDIYTGLMDMVPLRAMTAANLALFYQMDEALTVNYQDTEALTAASMVKTVCTPLLGAVQGLTDKLHTDGADQRKQLNAVLDAQKAANQPRIYNHPNTYCIYCDDLPTQAGLVIFPRAAVSRDDSNLVKYQVIEGMDLLLQALINPGPMRSDKGDGTVPGCSAHPPTELLSNPFVDELKLSCAVHAVIPTSKTSAGGSDEVKNWIGNKIEERISDFFAE
jgi:pimeloyl-ACP methyl ester carboxylesterase